LPVQCILSLGAASIVAGACTTYLTPYSDYMQDTPGVVRGVTSTAMQIMESSPPSEYLFINDSG
jgi:hypothetical protein